MAERRPRGNRKEAVSSCRTKQLLLPRETVCPTGGLWQEKGERDEETEERFFSSEDLDERALRKVWRAKFVEVLAIGIPSKKTFGKWFIAAQHCDPRHVLVQYARLR